MTIYGRRSIAFTLSYCSHVLAGAHLPTPTLTVTQANNDPSTRLLHLCTTCVAVAHCRLHITIIMLLPAETSLLHIAGCTSSSCLLKQVCPTGWLTPPTQLLLATPRRPPGHDPSAMQHVHSTEVQHTHAPAWSRSANAGSSASSAAAAAHATLAQHHTVVSHTHMPRPSGSCTLVML